jgi:predicted O-methyltransferase YrrM
MAIYSQSDIQRRAARWEKQPGAKLVRAIKPRSMLHYETLSLLYFFARKTREAILEIGTYTGGATVTMAMARKSGWFPRRCAPYIAIEAGGSSDNPFLPSADIIADFNATLTEFGVRDRVTLVKGWSNASDIVAKVEELLGDNRIGLLIIDANGRPDVDWTLYRSMMAKNAIVVCDDITTCEGPVGAPEKVIHTRKWVDDVLSAGQFNELGIYQWGTWFGQYVA